MKNLLNVSIVVPCYNESLRFPINDFEFLLETHKNIKLCFVNDGSTDGTFDILNKIAAKYLMQVSILHLEKNRGKGEAVRAGALYSLELSKPDYIAYLDTDLSAPIAEFKRLLGLFEQNIGLKCVFGSRVSVFGTEIHRLKFRHYGGRIVATMIDMVLKLKIYDTQCGLKIFRSEVVANIFEKPFLSRWLFDVEIFARLKEKYPLTQLKIIMSEVPLLEWNETGNSKIIYSDVLKIPYHLLKIWWKYRKKNMPERDLQPLTFLNSKILFKGIKQR